MTEEQYSGAYTAGLGPAQADPWRGEVQARLERYKRRRGRRIEGAFTMRFPFPEESATALGAVVEPGPPPKVEPIVSETVLAASAVAEEEAPTWTGQAESSGVERHQEPESPSSEMAEGFALAAESPLPSLPRVEAPPRPRPRRKIIAFPGPYYGSSDAPRRLADPVASDQLRILDVPEELEAIPATPFLDGLLDAVPARAATTAAPRDTVELPFAPAGVSARIWAALVDTALVGTAVAIFAAAAYAFLPQLAPSKSLIGGSVAVAVLLWAVYQYMFLVYSGRTLGMRAARIRLSDFKGRAPKFRQRQLRALGLYLSVLPLGMGVLWSFVDLDSLCWHDRISTTFLRSAE